MATVSKNQRAGKSVKAKAIPQCPKGHDRVWANYAARGRKNMFLMCECNAGK